MFPGSGPVQEARGRSLWQQVRDALEAASSWRGVSEQRLADLQTAVLTAQGNPQHLAAADARDVLEVVLDGRSATYFGTNRRGVRDAKLRGFAALLQPRAALAPQTTGLLAQEPPPRTREVRTVRTQTDVPAAALECRPPEVAAAKAASATAAETETSADLRVVDEAPMVLHQYQHQYVQVTERAMRVAASQTSPSSRRLVDRGYLVSPWQTGKSKIITPLAERARRIFPGKQVLIISPYKIITQQMVADLLEGFNGTIGTVDATHKEFDRAAIVASAWTLDNHLDKIDPARVGFIVVDEMGFVTTPTYRRLLARLGFVSTKGERTPTQGKYLLGMGVSGERSDGHHVREIFGDTLLAARGFNWFVSPPQRYLHDPLGLEVPYGESEADWERVDERGETVVVMRDSPRNRERLVNTYDRHLRGRKALVFTARVTEAEHLAADFNARYGAGYAAVIVGETEDALADELIAQFNDGRGPKVLLSVRRIAIGARFHGVEGIMWNHQTDSWNAFGQQAGRGLARLPGEPQRSVLLVVMQGRAKPLESAQSAATLLGYTEDITPGEVYRPRELRRVRQQRGGVEGSGRKRSKKLAKFRIGPERFVELKVRADRFGRAMQSILDARFDGDIVTMAERSGISYAACDAYLHGVIPVSYRAALDLEQRFGVPLETLTEPWSQDMMALVDAEHPLPAKMPSAKQRLVRLIRQAMIRQNETGSLLSIVRGDRRQYPQLQKGFVGDLPIQAGSIEFYLNLILDAGVVDETEARLAIGEYVEEAVRRGSTKAGGPAGEHTDREFDHRHVDLMTSGEGEEFLECHPDRRPRLGGPIPYAAWSEAERVPRGEECVVPEEELPRPASEEFEAFEQADQTRRALSTLTPREELVMQRRFGISTGDFDPSSEIAGDLKVTRERINQIEAKAFRKLRHPSRSTRLLAVSFRPKAGIRASASEELPAIDKIHEGVVDHHRTVARQALAELEQTIGGHLLQPYNELFERMTRFSGVVGPGFIRFTTDIQPLTLRSLARDLRVVPPWLPEFESNADHPLFIETPAPTRADFWNALTNIFRAARAEYRHTQGDKPPTTPKAWSKTLPFTLGVMNTLTHIFQTAARYTATPVGYVHTGRSTSPRPSGVDVWFLEVPRRLVYVRLIQGHSPRHTSMGAFGADVADDLYWAADRRVRNWWQETQGERLPATPENLAQYNLLDPATMRGRALRYLPAEGIPGLASVFAAPLVTQHALNIDPLRNPGGFHAANLGVLHGLNATGAAASDVILQVRGGTSAVKAGAEIATSPSLARTFFRSVGQRLRHVGGLAEGTVWAYPGFVAGDGATSLVTDNPTARAVGGGAGAIGVPIGLKVYLGEAGMQSLSSTAVGRLVPGVGTALLAKDVLAGGYESKTRADMSDTDIALRQHVINELPWINRQFCAASGALFMSGVGIPLGALGVVSCEDMIDGEMDKLDGGSRSEANKMTPEKRAAFLRRVGFTPLSPLR